MNIHEQVDKTVEENKEELPEVIYTNLRPPPKKTRKPRTKKVKKVVEEPEEVLPMIYDKQLKDKKTYVKKRLYFLRGKPDRKSKKMVKSYTKQLDLYNTRFTDNIDDIM